MSEREADAGLSRQRPLAAGRTALLIVDAQNWVMDEERHRQRSSFYADAHGHAIPNMQRLIAAAREAGIEVAYTVMENLTADGRDRSLDYKLSGFFIAPGSWEGRVIDALAPGEDELVLAKTSSSLFNSTVFDYVMRNIGIDSIIVAGFLTDQCVDHAIRDGADRGYYMICAADACATDSRERHEAALNAFKGYCRTMPTEALLAEMTAAQ